MERNLLLKLFLTLCSFIVGALVVVQVSMNVHVGIVLGSPIRGSVVSFWTGASCINIFCLIKNIVKVKNGLQIKKHWWNVEKVIVLSNLSCCFS